MLLMPSDETPTPGNLEFPEREHNPLIGALLRQFAEHTYVHTWSNGLEFLAAELQMARERVNEQDTGREHVRLMQEVFQLLDISSLPDYIRGQVAASSNIEQAEDALRFLFRTKRFTATRVLEITAERIFLLGYENPGLFDTYEQPLVEYYGNPNRTYFNDYNQAKASLKLLWEMGEKARIAHQ